MADTDKPAGAHVEKTQEAEVPSDASSHEDGVTRDWTPEEERKLVWKIDFRVFPMLCLVFGLSLLDRTNISAAYIAGLAADLRLDIGTRYSVALLIFFPGYALFELPSNYVIRRLGARYWLSFLIFAWGCCVLGMGFLHDWRVLTVLRAFLGVFEAGLFPGAIFLIGSWYRQFETARRVSIFYMASLFASAFGSIFAYCLSLIRVGDGMYRSGWRWIFIIEGIATIVAAMIAPFFLVEFPERVAWLNPRQKHIAVNRIRGEKQTAEVVHPTVKQSLVMLMDWKLAVYSIQYFIGASSVYSLAFFQPIILREGMGFSYAKAQLLGSPPYIFTIFASLATAYISDKYRTRWPILVGHACTAITGLLIILYVHTPGVRYFGFFLAVFGTQANIPGSLAYGQSNTSKVEKKGVVAAAMISVGAAGGICGSTIFRSQDAPLYIPGMWSTIAMQILYIVMTLSHSAYLKRQNKLADEGKKPTLEDVEGFRYAP